MWPGWDSRPGFFVSTQYKEPGLSCLSGRDVRNFHLEVESLSRQGMIEIDDDGFVFDFVDAHGDRFPLRGFRCQHRSYLLHLKRELVLGIS